MTEVATDFFLMDDREYVHGTTLLNTMLELLDREAAGPVRLRRIKFQKEIHSNGRIIVSTDPKLTESFREVPCFMTCEVDHFIMGVAPDAFWEGENAGEKLKSDVRNRTGREMTVASDAMLAAIVADRLRDREHVVFIEAAPERRATMSGGAEGDGA